MAVRDPYSKCFFRVEVEGVSPGAFQQVQGLSWESEVLEFQEGGRNDHLIRLPGQGRLAKVTLTRGFLGNGEFTSWAKSAARGDSMRRSVDLVILNTDHAEVARYTLIRAWPSRFESKGFDTAQGLAVETLELSHEGIVKSGSGAPAPGGNVSAALGPVQAALAAAEQRARDAAQASRQVSDAAEAAAQAAGAAAAAVQGAAAAAGAAAGQVPAELPAIPASPPSGANPADANYTAGAQPSPPASGTVVAGTREAMVQGEPAGNVVPHDSGDAFASAMGEGGPAPAPAPGAPAGASGAAGMAASGAKGSAATSSGDWSDGASRAQPPGDLKEPPIQDGSSLSF